MFSNRSISLLSLFFAASLTLAPTVAHAQNYGYDNSGQYQQQSTAPQGQQAYQGYQSDPGQQAFGGGDQNGGYQNQQAQQQQYPSQSYGGDQYGNPQGDQTYYGYAADAQRNGAQVNSQPPPQQQYGNQQPVYGQQGNPAQQSANQPTNLQQFLDESDKQQGNNGGKQAKQKSAGPNKLVQAGGTLAKVGGNMAIGYFMGKAMQRNATNMGVPKRMTRSMPMTGMMGGLAGNPMAAAQMPMMGGGYYPNNYGYGGYGGYPPPGYGYPPQPYYPGNGFGAPMGANVMTGLNNLVNH